MANTSQIYGLQPYRTLSGADNNQQVITCVASDATAIFIGDPVKLAGGTDANGYITVTQGTAAAAIFGVVVGVEVDGDALSTLHRPASSTRKLRVNVDPNQIYIAQANAALAVADATKNASIVVASGSTVTGTSGVQINASTAAANAALELLLLGFPHDAANTPAALYNKVLCKINLSQVAPAVAGV